MKYFGRIKQPVYKIGFSEKSDELFGIFGTDNGDNVIRGYLNFPKDKKSGKICKKGIISGLIMDNGVSYKIEGMKKNDKLKFTAKSIFGKDKYDLVGDLESFSEEIFLNGTIKRNAIFNGLNYDHMLGFGCKIGKLKSVTTDMLKSDLMEDLVRNRKLR